MLTAEGCRDRRRRLLDRLGSLPGPALVLADPLHLRYLAGFHSDPFSLGGDYGGLLVLRPDGSAVVYHDDRIAAPRAHADEVVTLPWYDGSAAGRGPRRLLLLEALRRAGLPHRVHDSLGDPAADWVVSAIADLRRAKDPDEVALLRDCARTAEAGFAWARSHARAGMTELQVYNGVAAACNTAAGRPVVVYGDFAVSPGPERRGGPPTDRILADGDLFILDFSVVLGGYRSDFTDTLCIGNRPTAGQRRLFEQCLAAMVAGEAVLRAGVPSQAVYNAVRGSFAADGVADHFPHHAGHGLGLAHPEPPYFVRRSEGEVVVGDVVTLEPGLYVPGVGGVRVEHNYLVTAEGFERLSRHPIGPA